MGLEGCQRLMQFTQLLWCGLRRGIRVERGTRSALAVDGRENRRWGRDTERHENGPVLRRVLVVDRPHRLGNAERRKEGRRCRAAQKVALEHVGSIVERCGHDAGLLEDG